MFSASSGWRETLAATSPGTFIPISRFIKWLYCNKVTNNKPNTKETPVNCTNSKERFQPFWAFVYRRNTCVTGMRANNLPGNTPVSTNKTRMVNAGTHKVSHVKRAGKVTDSKSSITSCALIIMNKLMTTDRRTMIPVSIMNIPKTLPVLAPLHLCTPTILARRLMAAIAISI